MQEGWNSDVDRPKCKVVQLELANYQWKEWLDSTVSQVDRCRLKRILSHRG